MKKGTFNTRGLLLLSAVFFVISASSTAAQAQGPLLDSANPDRSATFTQPARPEKVAPTSVTAPQKTSFVVLAGQRLVSYLTNLRSAIERAQGLDEDERAKIITSINESIAYVQRQAVTANNSQNEDELNHQIALLKNFWQEKQNTVTYYLGLITGSGLRKTIERFHRIEEKFDSLYKRFEPSLEMIDLKTKFTTELQAAEASYTKARDTFAQIKTPGDHKDLFTAGLQSFHEAHVHLKEARKISREIISKLRTTLGVKPSNPTSTPEVQP